MAPRTSLPVRRVANRTTSIGPLRRRVPGLWGRLPTRAGPLAARLLACKPLPSRRRPCPTASSSLRGELFVDIPSHPLLCSQAGASASCAFTVCCACRSRLRSSPVGVIRAACARSGIVQSRGAPLERAAPTVRREAGALTGSMTTASKS